MINKEFAESIFGVLNTFHDMVKKMQEAYAAEDYDTYVALHNDLLEGVNEVREVAKQHLPADDKSRLADACTCIIESAKNIYRLADEGSTEVAWKLENELEDFVEATEVQYLYWNLVKYYHFEYYEKYQEFLRQSHMFKRLFCDIDGINKKYDLSIMVMAYNKLDYTKKCVESIFDNLPDGVSYEIILINHGSSDGTKEYFESLKGVHVINFAVNCALPCSKEGICDARYIIFISNDVIVGKNAIQNLYRSISENKEYGFVVPTTSNVSNLQTIPAEYNSIDEFIEFTQRNNDYDERKHEQRVRLCNPVSVYRIAYNMKIHYEHHEEYRFNGDYFSFPDDKTSLFYRREGLKNVLAKDAYCHHFGSVTLNDKSVMPVDKQKYYEDGRNNFLKKYQIDPWGTGFCYDLELFDKFAPEAEDGAHILGINCGLGSNSLKVKEIMKEKGAKDIILDNVEQNSKVIEDLRGISDKAYHFENIEQLPDILDRKFYKYIVVEDDVKGYEDRAELIKIIVELGFRFETLAVKMGNNWFIIGN